MYPGGGMIVGPDHPMFGGRIGQSGNWSDPNNIGRFPPGSVPQGARFDPVTPFGPRPNSSMRGRPSRPGFGIGTGHPFR